MKRTIRPVVVVALLLALVAPAFAQWDASKPPTGPGPAVSADIRNNWDALARTVGTVNLLADPTFLMWPAGDAAAPAHWNLNGAGAAIARAGTGLGDTNRKVGDFCAKVTSAAGAAASLNQRLASNGGAFGRADFLKGQTVSVGAWVRTSSASAVRISIADGVGTSSSAFHAGGSVWTWLTVTHTINGGATFLNFIFDVSAGTVTGYLSGPTFILGAVPPAYYQPAPVTYENWYWRINGNLSVAASVMLWRPARPGIVKDVQLEVVTAPTTQAIIVDLETWSGAAFVSMFTTRPQIAAAGVVGGARPDHATYSRRCIAAGFDTDLSAGTVLKVDVDQVGSGTVGADLTVHVRVLTYARPLEEFLNYNDVS